MAKIRNSAKARKKRKFKAYKPATSPPSGTYDPALDAQEQAGNRGLMDYVQDNNTEETRSTTDYGTALQEIARQKQYQTEDLDRGVSRATEDYGLESQNLGRRYGLLAEAQAGNQAAAGVDMGGTALAAATRRAQNQGLEQTALDREIGRYREDVATNRTRLDANAAYQTNVAGLSYQRAGEDRTTGETRAKRENTQYGTDIGAQRFYQAKLAGWEQHKPENEKTKQGVTYRVRGQGQGRQYTLPSGRRLSRDEWVNTWRRRGAGGFGQRSGALRG